MIEESATLKESTLGRLSVFGRTTWHLGGLKEILYCGNCIETMVCIGFIASSVGLL